MPTYLANIEGVSTGAASLEELADRLAGRLPELTAAQTSRPGAHTRAQDVAGLVNTRRKIELRAVDDDHPEYGEAEVTVRTRGGEVTRTDPQAWLGGRPLTKAEQGRWDKLTSKGA